MSVPPSDLRSSRPTIPVLAIPVMVALAYSIGHLTWYAATPLGRVPVMDEQEVLALAEGIARGTLPPEPFYRAPGYALILATFRWLGMPLDWLFFAALAFGSVLHAVNAGLVAVIARTLFSRGAALAAGTLFALHPVFVHHAAQALDATPAVACFLVGLAFLAPELARSPETPRMPGRWAAASLAWAAATALRPNYFLVWLTLPLLALLLCRRQRRICAPAALAGVIIFFAVAGWQWRASGQPGFLPWQGAYNLWAANSPGVHGRYYVQRHSIPSAVAARMNPARAESMYFYRQETGTTAPDIQTLNAHWRRRFLEHVRDQPGAWLAHLGHKLYALLNTWEQYNNKTYAFHQARSPWLRWNPVCWGVVFVLAVAGFARLVRETPRTAASLGLIAGVSAASIVLFFVSGRFRLPLAAIGVVLAGGALAAPGFWRRWPRSQQALLGGVLLLAAALTFSAFGGVRDNATFVQDHALLARAADTVGDDALAWTHARAALALQPQHRDAERVAVTSYFNLLVRGQTPPAPESAWREVCAGFLNRNDHEVADLRAIAALALWREPDRSRAVAEWRALGPTPSAVAARLLVDDIATSAADFSGWRGPAWDQPLVRLAALRFNLTPPAGLHIGDPARAGQIAARLFGHLPTP